MKKKLFLLSALLSFSTLAFSQTTARSDINTTLNDWIIPIIIFELILATALTIISNSDGMWGKSGSDSKQSWVNIGKIVVYVSVGISILYFVVSKTTTITISI